MPKAGTLQKINRGTRHKQKAPKTLAPQDSRYAAQAKTGENARAEGPLTPGQPVSRLPK
jgi:hypothetical protein